MFIIIIGIIAIIPGKKKKTWASPAQAFSSCFVEMDVRPAEPHGVSVHSSALGASPWILRNTKIYEPQKKKENHIMKSKWKFYK